MAVQAAFQVESKMKKKTKKPYTGRDTLMVKIKNGATKAAVHVDRKKEANKQASKKPIEDEEVCLQCGFPLRDGVYTSKPDGFCCDSCKEYYNGEGDE